MTPASGRGRQRMLHAAVLGLAGLLCTNCTSSSAPRKTTPQENAAVDAAAHRVRPVLHRLLKTVPRGTCRTWGIQPASVPNASMNSDGVLLVTTGLVEMTASDDMLAFALAHELAHAVLDHPRRSVAEGWIQVLTAAAAAFAAEKASGSRGDAAWAGAGVFLTSSLIFHLPERRRRETEADLKARDLLRLAGYRPEAGAGFWRLYARLRPGKRMPNWLSSHPADHERARRLEQP